MTVRQTWLAVLALCGAAVLLKSALLALFGGIALTAWSIALARNWLHLTDAFRERGRVKPMFALPVATYRSIGYSMAVVGIAWIVVAATRIVS